jgi:hypothetical protein
MIGSGVGKIWMDDDAFSRETDQLLTAIFNAHDSQRRPHVRALVDTHTFPLWAFEKLSAEVIHG